MISAPRFTPPRHPSDCGCDTCTDPTCTWLDELAAPRAGDRWQAIDLKRRPEPDHHKPEVTARPVDLAGFEQQMGDLTRQARWGDSQQGRRT